MIYDRDYIENYLRNYSATAGEINRIRWKFIASYKPESVLDFGSGVGWFRAFAPENVSVDTYDIAPVWQTGIKHKEYDMITFWDVLEHIKDVEKLKPLLNATTYVAVSVPIFSNSGLLTQWKHYKPGEHFHHFTMKSFLSLMNSLGLKVIEEGQPECPPRTDIYSFVLKRR